MPPKDPKSSLTKLLLEKLKENQKQENARHEAMVEALKSITIKLSQLTVQPPPPADPPDPNYPYDKTTNSPPLPHITLTTTPFNPFPYNHNKASTPNQQYYPYQQPHQVQISTLENKTQMPLLQNPNTESETKDPNSIINSEKEDYVLMSQISEVFNIGESFSTANTTVTAENKEEDGNKDGEIFEKNVKVVDLERKKLLKEKDEGVLRVASNMEEQNILMKKKREVGETVMMRETLEKNEMNMVGLQNRKDSLIQVILAQVISSPSFDALNRSGPLDTVRHTLPFFKGLWSGPLSINNSAEFPIHLIDPSMTLFAQESFFNNSDTPKSLPTDDKKQMHLVSSPPSTWKAKAPQLSPNSHPIFSLPMAHDESSVTKFVSDYIIKKSHFSS